MKFYSIKNFNPKISRQIKIQVYGNRNNHFNIKKLKNQFNNSLNVFKN